MHVCILANFPWQFPPYTFGMTGDYFFTIWHGCNFDDCSCPLYCQNVDLSYCEKKFLKKIYKYFLFHVEVETDSNGSAFPYSQRNSVPNREGRVTECSL